METKVCKYCGKEKPIEQFLNNQWGYTSVCKVCNGHRISAGIRHVNTDTPESDTVKRKRVSKQMRRIAELEREMENVRSQRLNDFTPRELMLELKRRGYQGTVIYIEEHRIDLDKLT